jgi:small subunit ribosomal protein S16
MAVKLRLRREGTKKAPHYRIVVADARSPRDGRFLEIIGEYHPLDQPSTIKVDGERALYWLRNGAQPTDQVKQILRIEGVWEEFKPGDKPKRDRSAQGEKVKLSKKAKARAAEEAEAAAAPAEEPAAEEPAAEEPAEGADEAAEGGEEESS